MLGTTALMKTGPEATIACRKQRKHWWRDVLNRWELIQFLRNIFVIRYCNLLMNRKCLEWNHIESLIPERSIITYVKRSSAKILIDRLCFDCQTMRNVGGGSRSSKLSSRKLSRWHILTFLAKRPSLPQQLQSIRLRFWPIEILLIGRLEWLAFLFVEGDRSVGKIYPKMNQWRTTYFDL